MLRAKDMADRIVKAGEVAGDTAEERTSAIVEEALNVVGDMLLELDDTAAKRQVKRLEAVLAVFREYDERWVAVCRRVPNFDTSPKCRNMFRHFALRVSPFEEPLRAVLGWENTDLGEEVEDDKQTA